MTKLTTQDYWETYYKKSTAQRKQIEMVVSKYDKFWDLLVKNNETTPKTIIEIGGYPGRFLAYLASRYDLTPTSLDFNSDKSIIEESFKSFGIEKYDIIVADFFNHEPTQEYDIVISNGFIEHFEDFPQVMDNHLKYLKKGGTLLIMIPNKRYYSYLYKVLVDKKNLDVHNLKCMNFKTFQDFAKRNKIETICLENFGEFQFSVHQKLNLFQKLIFKSHRLFFKFYLNKYIEKNPTKYFSSAIVAIFKN
jgi:cyclopropane fatty-acyl-phospholipid synthase-like methyltransferase